MQKILNPIKEWEKKWRKDLPKFSEKEWLKIFPQAKPFVKKKIKELEDQIEDLSYEIYKDLLKIYKRVKDDFSIWFWEKVVEVFRGEELKKLEKRLKELNWAVSPVKRNTKNSVTKEEIQRAREYPFENLIEFNRAKKALCMFHNEKHPSLSLNPRTNRIKCFGCGINYDPIEYIMKTKNLSFVEAVGYLNNL